MKKLILLISFILSPIVITLSANENELALDQLGKDKELFRKAVLEELKKQEEDKILEKEYRRQHDSIFNSYISASDIEEIEKRINNNLHPVGDVDTFLTVVYEKDGDHVSFKGKPVNDCAKFDNDELSSSCGLAYSNSLLDAREIAYNSAFINILSKMGGKYHVLRLNDISCENLNTWKENLFINYKRLSSLTDKIKVCEKYICRDGVYTVLMYLNINHKDLEAVKDITYQESDFDNLYKSDKKFSNIIKEHLYLLYGTEVKIGSILFSYPVEVEECVSCPGGWKLVKLKQ